MKSLLKLKKEISSTTTERRKKLQVKENNHLFNYIDKLAVDHDVTVSNTMIKITYKKALKDQNASDSTVDCNTDLGFTEKKNKSNEAVNLCSSDISFIVKSPKELSECSKEQVFHSTPKPPADNEKKNYINGLNLSVKVPNSEQKSFVTKAFKSSTSQEHGLSNPKKCKPISCKSAAKTELDKRFLKNSNIVKTKSISQSNSDSKKMKLNKVSIKKLEKLENTVKKKAVVDKKSKKIEGLKRKVSNTELSVLSKSKKIKLDENKTQGTEGCLNTEESNKSNKKPIMFVDPDLPTGWTRFIRTKNKGSANEQHVVYVVNPQGKKFRFKWKLRKYLQRTNSSLDADQFFFGLYQRSKATNTSGNEKDGESTNAVSLRGVSRGNESEYSPEPENLKKELEEAVNDTPYESNNDQSISSDGKEILVFDPDLPFGWKRIIHSNSVNGRKQVHIISPDGKIFRRRYRLNEYLIKHQYTHSLDRFYFGLYPKKAGNASENLGRDTEEKTLGSVKMHKPKSSVAVGSSATNYKKTNASATDLDNDRHSNGDSKAEIPSSPMYDDPNLPEGWKRFIKIRSCGESAGRMEVIIVSPDGRRHRSRKHLEHYLKQKQLSYKAEDFDFTVSGRSTPKSLVPYPSPPLEPESSDLSFLGMKKKFTDKPVPELDISSLKETMITPEGHLINEVNGLMVCSGLSSIRNERRQRLPKGEHEKEVKSYLSSEVHPPWNGSDIPAHWIQRLAKCRADFKILEPDAAATVAETTKEFIKMLSLHSLRASEQAESGLKYEDLAGIVDRTECLSFLKTLIPQKITFKEFIKLNRPKQFMSFT